MEIYERIRDLRKNNLHLSQTEFGERLGVSRSVIKNIEANVLARPDQKMSLYKLICSEFGVNEDWLLNGNEPMFIHTPTSTMEQLRKEFNLDDFSYNLVYEYLKLDDEQRSAVREFVFRLVDSDNSGSDLFTNIPDTPEELEKLYPPIKNNNKVG